MTEENKLFAQEIKQFLNKHAKKLPDFDPEFDDESESYTSPDASILHTVYEILTTNDTLPHNFSVDSSWGSGGYYPYGNKEAKEWHDSIVKKCNEFKISKKYGM